MTWFKSKQEQLTENLQDEQAYALAAYEIANREIRPGLWAKAFVEAAGNEQRAQGVYIKLRVAQVKLGIEVTAEMIARMERQPSGQKFAPEVQTPPTALAPEVQTPPTALAPENQWECIRCGGSFFDSLLNRFDECDSCARIRS
jgi:hypothetical protein